jgi:group I intron endonuclease
LLIVPIVTYNNTYQDKDLILKQNRKKSGIYRGVQIESAKSYTGSSVNLSIRFSQYFNYNHISDYKHNMAIYRALLRYGYTPFRLEILEYCSREKLMEREQLYLDKCKPKYNILKLAGSSVGFKHSEPSKELKSQLAKGRLLCTETLLKMKERTVL